MESTYFFVKLSSKKTGDKTLMW